MKFLGLLLPFLAVSCTTLPNPYNSVATSINPAAAEIIAKSAAAHGDPWKRYNRINVSFEGEWGRLATKIQPVLTDPFFRKSSVETYSAGRKKVFQTHTGSSGVKTVLREGDSVTVSYNGTPSNDSEQNDAAALVTDAHTIFIFGSSWLAENGAGFQLLPSQAIDGESCHLVSGKMNPGLGRSTEDKFIAWISKDTALLKRFQFTLNGLESTKGADVDVVFSEMRTLPDGSVWPTHFLEFVHRPIKIKAHEWNMTSLSLDSEKQW